MARKNMLYYKAAQQLKEDFERLCDFVVNNPKKREKLFCQWLIRNLCHCKQNYHMIPNPETAREDADIIKNMIEYGCPSEDRARVIYGEIIKKTEQFYTEFNGFRTSLFNVPEYWKTASKYVKMLEEDVPDLTELRVVKVSLRKSLYLKLISQYCSDPIGRVTGLVQAGSSMPSENINEAFFMYIFDCVFNYHLIRENGLQLCVPPQVMKHLQENLRVETELFASPLNSTFKNFHSLFEIDRYFGSKGSFYTLDDNTLLIGGYEINPPFVESVFDYSADMVNTHLRKANENNQFLLFFYVIPWRDCKGYEKLVADREFVAAELELGTRRPY